MLSELRLIENFPLQFHAPTAPIRTGEIEQYQLVLRFGFRVRRLRISKPFQALAARHLTGTNHHPDEQKHPSHGTKDSTDCAKNLLLLRSAAGLSRSTLKWLASQ